jgi:hypothetical protein
MQQSSREQQKVRWPNTDRSGGEHLFNRRPDAEAFAEQLRRRGNVVFITLGFREVGRWNVEVVHEVPR